MDMYGEHFKFALFVPAGWALILYPFFRFWRRDWRKLIIIAVILSAIAMTQKERFDPFISVDDIAADLLGVFFGTAFVSAIFIINDRRFVKKGFLSDQEVSLRGFLTIARKLEERSARFYTDVAAPMRDPKVKGLCLQVASDELQHAKTIGEILERWLPVTPSPDLVRRVDQEIVRQNIFTASFPENATAGAVLLYALEQEGKTRGLYENFKAAFPDEGRKEYAEMLINGERFHEAKIRKALQELS